MSLVEIGHLGVGMVRQGDRAEPAMGHEPGDQPVLHQTPKSRSGDEYWKEKAGVKGNHKDRKLHLPPGPLGGKLSQVESPCAPLVQGPRPPEGRADESIDTPWAPEELTVDDCWQGTPIDIVLKAVGVGVVAIVQQPPGVEGIDEWRQHQVANEVISHD